MKTDRKLYCFKVLAEYNSDVGCNFTSEHLPVAALNPTALRLHLVAENATRLRSGTGYYLL